LLESSSSSFETPCATTDTAFPETSSTVLVMPALGRIYTVDDPLDPKDRTPQGMRTRAPLRNEEEEVEGDRWNYMRGYKGGWGYGMTTEIFW